MNLIRSLIQNQKSENQSVNRLFSYSFWSFLGNILSRFFTFIAWIVVARLLEADEYGQVGIIRSTANTFILFAGFGIGVTATKYLSDHRVNNKKLSGELIGLSYLICLVTGTLSAALVFLFAPLISGTILHAPFLENELRWTSLLILFSAINGAQTGIINGLSEYKTGARLNLINGLIALPVIVLGAWFERVTGTVYGLIAAMFVNVVVTQFALLKMYRKHVLRIRFRITPDILKMITNFSLPALFSNLLVNPVRWIANALLVREVNGFFELGIFTAVIVIQNFILLATSSLNAPFINMLSNSNKEQERTIEWLNLFLGWVIGFRIIEVFLTFSQLGGVLFGEKYLGSSFHYTWVLVLFYTSIILFKQGLARIMIVRELMWFSFVSNLIWGILVIGSLLYLYWLLTGKSGYCHF